MDDSAEQTNNNKPWLYKKGQSGNPSGRPKGSKTLKTYLQERFNAMSDEERETFLEGLPKDTVWKMAEGNPESKTDITTKGDKINTLDPRAVELASKYEEELKQGLNGSTGTS